MSQTRCGISAKQLERELGVTYKTAWRMANKIRSLLQDEDDTPFSGTVEMDEKPTSVAVAREPRGAVSVKTATRLRSLVWQSGKAVW